MQKEGNGGAGRRTTARTGNMTQEGWLQQRYSVTTHIHSDMHCFNGFLRKKKNSLARLGRGLERSILTLLFLKHAGRWVESGKLNSLALVLLLLLGPGLPHLVDPTRLSSVFGASVTHSRQHRIWRWQLLPDRLAGVSPPRHPPGEGRRTGPTCSLRSPPFLPPPCPSFSSGPWDTLKYLKSRVLIVTLLILPIVIPITNDT